MLMLMSVIMMIMMIIDANANADAGVCDHLTFKAWVKGVFGACD